MSTLITERELDKMEVEAEVVVSKMEGEFEETYMGNRAKQGMVEEAQESKVEYVD
jgi:hypothetical protein